MSIRPLFARAKRFKPGQRVSYEGGKWVGTVTGEPSEIGLVWCRFDGVGQYGADPRKLTKIRTKAPHP